MSKKKKQFNAECANLLHYSTIDAVGSPLQLHMYLARMFLSYVSLDFHHGNGVRQDDLTAMTCLFNLLEDYHELITRDAG